MKRCCVPRCNNFDYLHNFPTDKDTCDAWVKVIKSGHVDCKHSDWSHSENSVICSDHFNKNDFRTLRIGDTQVRTRQLKREAVPSRHVLCKKVFHKRDLTHLNDDHYFLVDPISIASPESAKEFILETGDNIVSVNTQLKLEVNKLSSEHEKFKEKLSISFLDKRVLKTDIDVFQFTGIIKDVYFKKLLEIAKPELNPYLKEIQISLETQFLLLLVKLKMCIPDPLLCLVYSLSMTELHKVYTMWMEALTTAFIPLIKLVYVSKDWGRQLSCSYFGEFVNVTTRKLPTSRTSRTHWNAASKIDYQETTAKVFLLFRPSGVIIYVSELLPSDTSAISALRQTPDLLEALGNLDKVYIISSGQYLTTNDIELGVVLENDGITPTETPGPEVKAVLPKVKTTLEHISEYALLSYGLEVPFNEFSNSIVRICAVVSSFTDETPTKSSLLRPKHLLSK